MRDGGAVETGAGTFGTIAVNSSIVFQQHEASLA